MHVLILPSWYYTAGSEEISGRNFHQLAKALRDTGVDARILYAHYSPLNPLVRKQSFLVEDDVPTTRITQWFPPKIHTTVIKWWIKKCAGDVLAYVQMHGKPDLIHAQSYMGSLIANEVKNKIGVRFIYTEHLSAFIEQRIPSKYIKMIRESCDNAALITCVSPGLGAKLMAYVRRPITVVPNFYEPEIFYKNETIAKQEKFTWVSVGEPSHVKGLDILIKAFGIVRQRLPDNPMKLIMIDKINDKEKLLQLAATFGVSDDIEWQGLLKQNEIAFILRQSHVLVSASRVETFGTAIIEAQACGLPVAATHTDGAEYILQSSEQGLLAQAGDAGALAECMITVFANYNLYKPEKIIELVERRFSRNIVMNNWKDLYNQVCR